MNFTSQNYHRASNSQTNDGHAISVKQGFVQHALAANSTKKSQLIQPLKLIAFPKLMTEDTQMESPKTSHPAIKTSQHQQQSSLANTLQNSQKIGATQIFTKQKPMALGKKQPP